MWVFGLGLPGAPSAQEPPDPRRVLDGGAYQTELPGHDARAGSARAGQGAQGRRDRGARPGSGVLDAAVGALFAFLGPVVYWLTWIAAVVAVVLLVGFGLREAWRSLRNPSRAGPPPSPAPPEPKAPAGSAAAAPLSWQEIEALAARGAFGEAVHLLFLHLLERLREQGRLVLRSAATGRETLQWADLSDDSRKDLADLVATVERFHFAGRELAREDWERSRQIHRRLADVGGGA